MSQINWWIPLYDFESESSMAFHPRYWNQGLLNGSAEFNYYEWNATSRKNAAQHIKQDTRKQPHPEEPIELKPEIRVVCPPGGALLFSAAHLHSTVPNTSGRTRFSMDIRTVHIDDVLSMNGAPNIDSNSPTTSLRDFMRGSDLERVSDEVAAHYDKAPTVDGELVFKAPS
jgi:ectoine hydroxylase-related dioxygenase (phytanoyl-CoA dioxygenase family)